MTAEPENGTFPTDDDIDTTAPQSEPSVWRMPEPVFRKTSGKLPKGFVDSVELETAERTAKPEDEPTPQDPANLPIISDSGPEPKPKSPVLKIVIVAVALAAMIGFITVFLTIVYFWFLRGTGD